MEEVLILKGEALIRYKKYLETITEELLIYHEKGHDENEFYLSKICKKSKPTILRRNQEKELIHTVTIQKDFNELKDKLIDEEKIIKVDSNRIILSENYNLDDFVIDLQ